MKRAPWFTADKKGLAKLVRRRGLGYILHELLQNAWDTKTESVSVTVRPLSAALRTKGIEVFVEDQDPDGFKDLSHAYTLFAESEKKGDPSKRGRFNLGEKLVLALCDRAEIASTKGTIIFDKDGRRESRVKRPAGSSFRGILRMSQAEANEMVAAAERVFAPIPTFLNGVMLPCPKPTHVFETTLPTEVADEEGILRRTRRKTTVRVYGDIFDGWIYEMGIPVCQTGDPWTVEVMQKVPLNTDRDNVTPAYLQELRVAVVNELHASMTPEAARAPATQAALGDDRIQAEAVQTILTHQYGRNRTVFDPSDPESNKRAYSEGYNVIPGSAYSAQQWTQIRAAGAVVASGKVFPSPKPFSDDPDARAARFIPESEWTPEIRTTVRYCKAIARGILGHSIHVEIEKEAHANHSAAYGLGGLVLNIGRLGKAWFAEDFRSERVNTLLIHELAHDFCGDHLSADYHKACCDLGAKLARLALEQPSAFDRKQYETG